MQTALTGVAIAVVAVVGVLCVGLECGWFGKKKKDTKEENKEEE